MPSKSRKYSQSEVEAWSLDGVGKWLTSVKLESCIEEFLEQNVDGSTLLTLTIEDIKEMVQGDKQLKAMKKALSALPGNSVSKKKKKVDKKNTNAKKSRGPLPAEPKAPPLPPPNHPPSPGLPPGPPPPVPSGSSRPTFQRLGPPIPTTPRPMFNEEEETYDDPNAYGYDDGPEDMYDSVDPDEVAEICNTLPQGHSPNFAPSPPTFAPPPSVAPPPSDAPPGAVAGYDDNDEEIYDDGFDDDGDSFDDEDDSFDSSDPEDNYEEPFEENPPNQGLSPSDPRSRLASDANIRSIMGKFYAHGVLKEQAGLLATGASTSPGNTIGAPPPPGPPPGDQEAIIEEDIYDAVPDEVKDMIMAEQIEEDDIYDIPPDQEELQAAAELRPPFANAPKPTPTFNPPVMRAPIAATPKAPPPPPGAPPPEEEFEDDVYDIPSEVLEENQLQESVPNVHIYKPAAPPPPSNEQELPPGRPPKSPALPGKQLFTRPPMRPMGGKPPSPEELPPSRPPKPEPAVAPPPPPLPDEEPPKTNGVFNRPKLRSPLDRGLGSGGGGPPPRPSNNSKPPLRPSNDSKPPPRPPNDSKPAPASPNMDQGVTGDSIMDRLARLNRVPPRPSSPQHSPSPSPGLTRKSDSPDLPPTTAPPPPPGPPMKHTANKHSTPPITKKFGKPGLKHTNSDEHSEETTPPEPAQTVSPIQKVTNVTKPPLAVTNVTKPPLAAKNTKLADRMKMFEDNKSKPTPLGAKLSLKPPPKPPANESPMSGRKMEKNANVNELMSKFGGRASPSPADGRRSASPEVKPFLPPKPPGSVESSPRHPPWKKKDPSLSEVPPPPPLPSKLPEPASSSISKPPTKQWPPHQEAEEMKRTNSPISKKKNEPPPIPEELPPRRASPSMRRQFEPPPIPEELPPRRESPSMRRQFEPPPIPEELPPRRESPSMRRQFEPPPIPEELPPKRESPSMRRQFEPPPIPEELPPRRESPSMRRKFEPPPKNEDLPLRRESPSFRKKLSSDSSDDQEKKPFTYPNYKPQSKVSEDPPPALSLPPRIPSPPVSHQPDFSRSLPPRNSPSLPPRSQESHHPRIPDSTPSLPPRSADPTPSLPPRPQDTTPSLPPRVPEPMDSHPPHMPARPSPGQSTVPGPSIGGPPKLPDRPPPIGPPRLPDRNPPSHRPFSPPTEPEPRLPPRPPAQQAFPPLPNRPPPKEPPPEIVPNRPLNPKSSASYGSPVGQSWYHGNLDRKRSETKLRKYSKDGTFIIRDSSKIQGEYSLSLWHSRGIRHLRIRVRDDKKFVLGEEKADEMGFDTVIALVEYHKREPLHLRSGGDTVLKYECPR